MQQHPGNGSVKTKKFRVNNLYVKIPVEKAGIF